MIEKIILNLHDGTARKGKNLKKLRFVRKYHISQI